MTLKTIILMFNPIYKCNKFRFLEKGPKSRNLRTKAIGSWDNIFDLESSSV